MKLSAWEITPVPFVKFWPLTACRHKPPTARDQFLMHVAPSAGRRQDPTHPGLSADQRSSVWRWKFWFFLTSDLFVEHVSTTVHHQKLISAVWWQSVWDSCFQGNKAKEKRLWVKHLPVYLFNLQPPVSSSWSHQCPAALNLSFVILGTNKEKAVRWCSIKSENVRTLTQETENLVLCETTSWVENIT